MDSVAIGRCLLGGGRPAGQALDEAHDDFPRLSQHEAESKDYREGRLVNDTTCARVNVGVRGALRQQAERHNYRDKCERKFDQTTNLS